MLRVLIIDDNEAVCDALSLLLDLHDVPSLCVHSPDEGLAAARREVFGVIIQDMNFEEDGTSGEEGKSLFRALRGIDPYVPILLITAWTSLSTAVQLVKEGAHDYMGKPWDDEKLVQQVQALLALRARHVPAATGGEDAVDFVGMVYADPAMQMVVSTALKVAIADVSVLITGPNGSGKDMLARLIQANSRRRNGPFVTVNAGAFPGNLLESELFGAEAGAYTGARQRRIGRFEEADGGTLFLDEIGNLPMEGQVKLLRVLQSGEFSRLGSNQTRQADVRVLSATNSDLPTAIADGTFREDLYFRLNVVELQVPALKDRPGDILPLARHFLETVGSGKTLSPDTESLLLRYAWPGNVRELCNRLQRAALITDSDVIGCAELGLDAHALGQVPTSQQTLHAGGEAETIQRILAEEDGNVSRTAERLSLSRQAVYRRMEKFGIVWARQPKS